VLALLPVALHWAGSGWRPGTRLVREAAAVAPGENGSPNKKRLTMGVGSG